jgi:hypothetical protein
MRRIFVATLVLIPVLAHAQASNTTDSKPSQNSATLLAKATPPAPFNAPKNAAPAAKASAADAETVPANVVIHQADSDDDAMLRTSAVTYSFGGVNQASAPQLVHVVETELAPAELATASDVAVHLTVDANGVPQNLKITKTTNPVIAQKTLAAVSQYRFKPATVNYLAVPEDVTLDIKIK